MGSQEEPRRLKNSVPTTDNILDLSMESLMEDTMKFTGPILWDELQEGEGDKTWFERFGDKVKDVGNNVIEKAKDVKIHLNQMGLVVDKRNTMHGHVVNNGEEQTIGFKPAAGKDSHVFHMTALSLITKRIQALVVNHGYALELLRELFVKTDTKIEDLEEKVDNLTDMPNKQYVDHRTLEILEQQKVASDDTINSLKAAVDELKIENIKITKESEEIKKEVDEARQRGLKGNLLISCPPNRDGVSAAAPVENQRGTIESPQEMISRLILKKTGCVIPPKEMLACHRLGGVKNKHTWIIRVENRAPDSGWADLSSGMLTGKRKNGEFFAKNDGVYLNYQLTQARNEVLYQIRQARKKELISRFSVNNNGQIKVLRDRSPRVQTGNGQAKEPWQLIESLGDLRKLLGPNVIIPFPQQQQEQRDQGGHIMIGSNHNTPRR